MRLQRGLLGELGEPARVRARHRRANRGTDSIADGCSDSCTDCGADGCPDRCAHGNAHCGTDRRANCCCRADGSADGIANAHSEVFG